VKPIIKALRFAGDPPPHQAPHTAFDRMKAAFAMLLLVLAVLLVLHIVKALRVLAA